MKVNWTKIMFVLEENEHLRLTLCPSEGKRKSTMCYRGQAHYVTKKEKLRRRRKERDYKHKSSPFTSKRLSMSVKILEPT